MIEKTQFVSPVKRIAATIYDIFLLLGVWFGVGSIALWLNNSEILHPGVGLSIVIISAWIFYSFFWMRGGKTLGMAVWNIEIYSLKSNNITFMQATLRFYVNLLIFILMGVPLLQIYFSKDRLAINDRISMTSLRLI
ncbi:RDD family protein [Gammaproteobacteria bacterium]|nr:RDD family protein [Gammaproteobacteria bacterium]MDA7786121.1 RDD family protein [Gammaproteobacteria bacterium]MDA7802441.1 RDD family protein [Gammaproteobacteria bacterium]MDA7856374.1 RDD family protein [Gammaproteobacteria bacterium]MDA8856342.1 RDD family protein [Gammaproteobacteria bacterium]